MEVLSKLKETWSRSALVLKLGNYSTLLLGAKVSSTTYARFHNHCQVGTLSLPNLLRIQIRDLNINVPSSTRIPAELRDISDHIANTILLLRNFKSYIVYLTPQTISNEKIVNGKVVYLVEYFNLTVTSCSFDIVNHLKSNLTTYITYLDL